MPPLLRLIVFFVVMHICMLSGCSSDNSGKTTGKDFPVVVFSDVHFDPFYDQSLFPRLVASDATAWESIFKTSSISEPSPWGSGTNYPLLVRALSSIRQNSGTSPFAVFTGDILVHKFSQTFFTLYGSQDTAAMNAFAEKTVAFFAEQVRASVGTIPVIFAIGNNDSYYDVGPDSTFLSNTAETFYEKFLNAAEDRQGFLTTFRDGGYYSAEPPGTDLMVISLNTVPFSSYALVGDTASAAATELAWLDSQLASAKTAGKKVWLIMHVPPGADIYSTATRADSSGHIDTTSATMMWKADYQTDFQNILANYPGSIALSLAGHTHMDEYRILPTADLVAITPSIGTRSGNNPAFKVFTISHDTLKASDYTSHTYDLAAMPGEFNTYYTFSAANSSYGFLNDFLSQLFPELSANVTLQGRYREYYYSGHSSANPITATNWPVYWCGIGKMELQQFINCVNSY